MTVDDLDPALKRLNYRNGQRIVAADLRAEQAYHIGVRQWLNRTLFNPGIAKGLEVELSETDKHAVVVSPGLAIDFKGRELIVAEPALVQVSGVPSSSTGVVYGNYLVIEFREERGAPTGVECSGGDTAPSRVITVPYLSVQNAWPTVESGRIPLAQIELNAKCQVTRVRTAIRKYASTSKAPKVRNISLEGERDVTPSDHKTVYFHIRGGNPDSVSMYLRASRFAPTAYTEIGWHTHHVAGTTSDFGHDYTHTHNVSVGTLEFEPNHTHDVMVDAGERNGGLDTQDSKLDWRKNDPPSPLLPAGGHSHKLTTLAFENALSPVNHNHTLGVDTSGAGTDAGMLMRQGVQYTYFADLRILLDGTDISEQVRTQITASQPTGWGRLGDGTANHLLVKQGSGEIDLLQIKELGPGEHALELFPSTLGGRVHYNLYID